MKRREFLTFCVGAAAVASSGCATVSDARAERGTGVIVNYTGAYEHVWSAIVAIVKELDLKVAGDNKAEGYLVAETSVSAFSWGERIAVFVERIGTQGTTRVEVVSKRAIGANITASDWAPKIHEKLGQRFKRL
jgi:hypothetical protein